MVQLIQLIPELSNSVMEILTISIAVICIQNSLYSKPNNNFAILSICSPRNLAIPMLRTDFKHQGSACFGDVINLVRTLV
ncbi:hypothetical protein BA6E_106156 [Bacteroidales bacterium 6E]|nr:hypothetical protein BA6E_106156 [Bacteroidales bacterium 6E]